MIQHMETVPGWCMPSLRARTISLWILRQVWSQPHMNRTTLKAVYQAMPLQLMITLYTVNPSGAVRYHMLCLFYHMSSVDRHILSSFI